MPAPDEIKSTADVKQIVKATGLVKDDPVTAPFINTKSVLFPGVDQFAETSADVPELDGLTKCTWVLWQKQTSLSASQTFLSKYDYPVKSTWAFETDATGFEKEFRMYIAANSSDAAPPFIRTTSANIVAGIWYFLVMVYDGTLPAVDRLNCYVNAVLVTKSVIGTIPSVMASGGDQVRLAHFKGLSRYFGGNLTKIGIFPNVAFNQTEIDEAYNGGDGIALSSHSQSANLFNQWPIDGSVHPTLTDAQGNDDLTMVNMVPGDIVEDTF